MTVCFFTTVQAGNLKTNLEKSPDFELETGQIVLSESDSPSSILLTLFPKDFTPYTHGGIIVIEDGETFVYEANGTYHLSLTKPPSDTIKGKVVRTPWQAFIDKRRNLSVFAAPVQVDVPKMVTYLKKQREKETPFDAYFNYADDSSLYCSELMTKALEAGGHPTIAASPYRNNPSLLKLKEWLKLQGDVVMPLGSLVSEDRWLATYSRDYTMGQLNGLRAVKYEISNRFDTKQLFGNVIKWQTFGIGYQDEISRLFEEVKKSVGDSTTIKEAIVIAEQKANALYGAHAKEQVYVCSPGAILCKP